MNYPAAFAHVVNVSNLPTSEVRILILPLRYYGNMESKVRYTARKSSSEERIHEKLRCVLLLSKRPWMISSRGVYHTSSELG